MANCKRYEATIKGRPAELIKELSDESLARVVKQHRKPDFWPMYVTKPDQYAYVRRWATVCRREARRRGLL